MKKQPMSREEQLAHWMYPANSTSDMRKGMDEAAKKQGRRGPQQSKLLPDKERGAVSPLGGVAQGRKS